MNPRLVVLMLLGASPLSFANNAPRPTTRTTQPATTQAAEFEIIIDSSEVPELQQWADDLRPILEKWYPIIVEHLPSEGFTAPRKLTVVIRNTRGIAFASGTRITCAASYFKRRPDDKGAIVHELVHVAQQYRSRSNPGWLVEGIADYIRWHKYEPKEKRRRPNPDRAKYTDSYQTTAAFLEYICANHDHEFVVKINAAMRQRRYSPELWKQYTGKTVDELWELYLQTLRPQ